MSAKPLRHDILLPIDIEPAAHHPLRARLAAFVPITLAILGVSAILFGGLSARQTTTAEQTQMIDPIETGSIGN